MKLPNGYFDKEDYGPMYLLYSVYDGSEENESRGEQQEKGQLSLKPNSQTLRRSADRKADHVLRLTFLRGMFL